MINCEFEDGQVFSTRHAVVDVVVIKDDQILLVKRSKKLIFEGGKWAMPGGFIDRDERIPVAAAREVLEETGWQIKDLKLIRINDDPERPNEDRQNISFVFMAIATEKTGEPDWESDEVKWFDLDKLPDNLAFDHPENIELYKRYQKQPFDSPLLG